MIYDVICKDDEGFEDQLTKNKYYRILNVRNGSFFVFNDKNERKWYGMFKFEVVL